MTPGDFDAAFDRFETSTFRLETLQRYDVAEEAEDIAAWRRGQPQPERSVRTSPWLRRIALTTAAGKSWRRVHVVDLPLSEYLGYELVGYLESQAVGEEIRLADRSARPELADLDRDFWLFDADSPNAYAIDMTYDQASRFVGAELITAAGRLGAMRDAAALAWETGTPLNEFIVGPAASVVERQPAG